MISLPQTLLIPLLGLLAGDGPRADEILALDESRFRIEIPNYVLADVPVRRIRITALTIDGEIDPNYQDRPLIRGIILTVNDVEIALDRFRDGLLELTTDLAVGRKVFITEPEIVVDPGSRGETALQVRRLLPWWSITPPLLAILLAVWLRNIIVALFAAMWSGAVILSENFFEGLIATLDTYLIGELVQVGQTDKSHMLIILFTMFVGATVGVMCRSGGTLALVSSMSRFTKQREHGQVLTWMMGLVVFFDDYANTFLVGSAMRPVTDRLKISREKLAFLVDSTAAPIAGIAFISTWIGVEIGYISDTYERLGMSGDVYSTFLATIPYRFYSLHLLVFVWLIAYSGRDFGPMLKAETRALARGELFRTETVTADVTEHELQANPEGRHLLRNAFLPLASLLGFIVVGLWWTGSNALAAANLEAQSLESAEIPSTLWNVLGHSSPNRVMFLSAFFASIVAVGTAVSSRALKMREGIDAWVAGAKSMLFPVIILVMAWGVATICDENHLNTAGFLVEMSHGHLSVSWMPTLAFLLAGVVAFATGSSWSTMGLLMPLFISVTYYLLTGLNEAGPNHHLMLATIGAVLAGAIFGDHCSPISDTTVLSSAATRCDHFDHVATQLPYAACVAGVALLLGYVPIGLGIWQPILLLPPGVIVLYLLVQFLGRSVEEQAKLVSSADDAIIGDDLALDASDEEQSPFDAETASSL